jgi:hypothetical protein
MSELLSNWHVHGFDSFIAEIFTQKPKQDLTDDFGRKDDSRSYVLFQKIKPFLAKSDKSSHKG